MWDHLILKEWPAQALDTEGEEVEALLLDGVHPSTDAAHHVLSSDERKNGGAKRKWNPALQEVVNSICCEIHVSNKRPTLGNVEEWFVKNAEPEDPYESDTPDCDEIYIEGSQISWTDSVGNSDHKISLRALERYIERAKKPDA